MGRESAPTHWRGAWLSWNAETRHCRGPGHLEQPLTPRPETVGCRRAEWGWSCPVQGSGLCPQGQCPFEGSHTPVVLQIREGSPTSRWRAGKCPCPSMGDHISPPRCLGPSWGMDAPPSGLIWSCLVQCGPCGDVSSVCWDLPCSGSPGCLSRLPSHHHPWTRVCSLMGIPVWTLQGPSCADPVWTSWPRPRTLPPGP